MAVRIAPTISWMLLMTRQKRLLVQPSMLEQLKRIEHNAKTESSLLKIMTCSHRTSNTSATTIGRFIGSRAFDRSKKRSWVSRLASILPGRPGNCDTSASWQIAHTCCSSNNQLRTTFPGGMSLRRKIQCSRGFRLSIHYATSGFLGSYFHHSRIFMMTPIKLLRR